MRRTRRPAVEPRLIYDKPRRTIVAASSGWVCAASKQGTAGGNDPADCNWPFCGCDPYADKVLAAIQESGYLIAKPAE
jgi:hypothetical protein